MAVWRKTKQGEWVVYAPLADLDEAKSTTGSITVTAKSGAAKAVRIDSIGKPFKVDGVEMAYGYPAPTASTTTRRNGSSQSAASGTCDNCYGRGAKHYRADSSGIGGHVCNRCSSLSQHELSFA